MRKALVLAIAVAACATGSSAGPAGPPPLPGPLPQALPGGEGSTPGGDPPTAATATATSIAAPTPTSAQTPSAQTPSASAQTPTSAQPPPTSAQTPTSTPSAPLPAPLPAPEVAPVPPPAAVDLSDPLELLWGHRLEFAGGGEPIVTIRLMEGQREVAFRPLGPARLSLRGGATVEVPANVRLAVRARDTAPAAIAHHALLADAPLAEHARLEALRREYEASGVAVLSRVVGGVYGIGGRVVDNRRELLLAASDGTARAARAALAGLGDRLHGRPAIHSEVIARPRGTLELRAEGGAPLGEADAALSLEVEGDRGFVVEGVEHETGPAARGREDRTYRGRLYVTIDAAGALAAVHGISLEELLRGLVPSEMPGGSHLEALKAQAVTARSNVLAQIGTRHLTDPFMLCAEVHCQAYRGDGARTPRTDEAVRATRGEALFRADRTLVDAVYSAMCGGHGEDNDKVWPSAPDPSLRGRPDLPLAGAARWEGGLSDEARLRAFLAAAPDAWCRRPAAARKDRFRWERRLSAGDLDRLASPLAVGHVRRLAVASRGVSGRARLLEVEGDAGRAEVAGELAIRRLLGNLPSAMFVVERDRAGGVVLAGGGWGHGAGMCQWGAVGRAEAGQGYREILRAYYAGAEVAPVY